MIIYENMADSINRPGRLFNFGPKGGRLYRGWTLIFFPTFSASQDILENNKARDKQFISLKQDKTKCKS